ncbi:MAG: glycolate oxidase subunit GlcF, partial [Burkholderiales bacterium]|nr:glycolate oxidase subunit GlcF [Burkholderiales bacterium]
GQALAPLLPAALREKVPARRPAGTWPAREHARKVLILNGCTQPAMMPNIDAATARVLDRLGVQTLVEPRSGCCGAIRHHLNDEAGALSQMRANIDAWWPRVEAGVEAIIVNASGCGAMVKDYAHLLRHDADYAAKAARIVELTRDPIEWLPALLASSIDAIRARVAAAGGARLVFHPPCTLQHGQRIRGEVEQLLAALGATVLPVADAHLCCGSAGTYSVLQPALSKALRERKLGNLQLGGPQLILSANIGCLAHLQAGTETPVRHWIEWLDEAMAAAEFEASASAHGSE